MIEVDPNLLTILQKIKLKMYEHGVIYLGNKTEGAVESMEA